ncbi:hypothetical protein FOA52_008030 [Chlamydomonas sp. UWO 241]|nr:hypothetical protein FOA52_009069 [Chlamydomonas sp. UWO 241]KAG1657970.1 hypothetical protein FOA52_008030 [Chlamydomonas sp. UWO 241]
MTGHVSAVGGSAKNWDTVKPIAKYFARPHRVVLFDDDAHKAAPGEESNLVRVPVWDDHDDTCDVLPALVDAVLQVLGPLGKDDDVREHTATIAQLLAKHQHAGGAAERAMIEEEEAEERQEERQEQQQEQQQTFPQKQSAQPLAPELRQPVGVGAEAGTV